jgi:hypothetical protein
MGCCDSGKECCKRELDRGVFLSVVDGISEVQAEMLALFDCDAGQRLGNRLNLYVTLLGLLDDLASGALVPSSTDRPEDAPTSPQGPPAGGDNQAESGRLVRLPGREEWHHLGNEQQPFVLTPVAKPLREAWLGGWDYAWLLLSGYANP